MAIENLTISDWLRLTFAILLFMGPGFAVLSFSGRRRKWWLPTLLTFSLAISVSLWAIALLWLSVFKIAIGAMVATMFFSLGWVAGLAWRYLGAAKKDSAEDWKTNNHWANGILWLTILTTLISGFWSLRSAVVAPGSDSYHHTLIVQLLMDHGGIPDSYEPYARLATFTYHYGYHSIACALVWLSGIEPRLVVALLNQLLVAAACLSAAVFVGEVCKSCTAAGITAAMAGLVCAFPGYMINWGRSAQLCGLVLLPPLLLCLWSHCREGRRTLAPFWVGILAAGMSLSHYRVAIMALIAGAIFALLQMSPWKGVWPRIKRITIPMIEVAGICFCLLIPWLLNLILANWKGYANPVDSPGISFLALDRLGYGAIHYPTNTAYMALSGLCLAVGFWMSDKLTIAMAIWSVLMLISSRVSPAFDTISVLISLYLPLSLVVGHIYSRFLSWIGKLLAIAGLAALLIFAMLAIWGAWLKLSIVEPAHAYVLKEDFKAMQWVKMNIPESALFLVNTVHANYSANFVFGSDSGYWLPLFGKRSTITLPMIYGFERSSKPALLDRLITLDRLGGKVTSMDGQMQLRKYGVTHVFIGTRGRTLSAKDLDASPAFQLLYREGGVSVFSFKDQLQFAWGTSLSKDSSANFEKRTVNVILTKEAVLELGRKYCFGKLIRRITLFLVITLIFLELTTRLIWWNQSTVELFGNKVTLLPFPLVTAKQIEILRQIPKKTHQYLRFDPVLGWSIVPNINTTWAGNQYTSNNIGIRSLREYELTPPNGITRIAAFGPSFTHSEEVNDNETWSAQIEQRRSNLEVMNWGVGGYGTDQSFLRYKLYGAVYRPEIVLIGFEEHNWNRNVNRFRAFEYRETGGPLTKPVYVIQDGKLVLIKNPFDDFNRYMDLVTNKPDQFLDLVCPWDRLCDDSLYRSRPLDILFSFRFVRTLLYEINRDPNQLALNQTYSHIDPYKTTLEIIQMFIHEVTTNQARPIIVLFPLESTLLRYEELGTPAGYKKDLLPILDRSGVQYIDLFDAFVKEKENRHLRYQDLFASKNGHYNYLGNEVVADTILAYLCDHDIIKRDR